ncbi:arylsulfatase [Herpetosiphon llansteffanensis]|uniref:arylsulfatase n=1 Tax=Herpetosiphon llansteffanensis TaxID=2094568 RepID=UPI000D7D0D4B|nr:arylsulfatase [Herpetosiphon llansteffanensis]
MINSLGLIHTAAVHVATFDQLIAEIQPNCAVEHVVVPALLEQARHEGLSAAVAQQLTAIIADLQAKGMQQMLCTCSTLGGLAETLNPKVVRVDRAMAEQAIGFGSRIAVVAALESTLEPTKQLLHSIAQAKPIQIDTYLCGAAWQAFLANDQASYLQQIATQLEQIQAADVIVLAQASMANAIQLCQQRIPILSSPRSAIASLFAPNDRT